MLFDRYSNSVKSLVVNTIAVISILGVCFYTGFDYSMPLDALKVIKNNIYLIPNSTMHLGEVLEQYYSENGEPLKMIMTPGVTVDGFPHLSSQIVRAYSPHTVSVTGALRIDEKITNKDSEFYGYDLSDIDTLNNFIVKPNNETLHELELLVNKYPVNCIVLNDNDPKADKLLEQIGFIKYKTVEDKQVNLNVITYNIFVKK